LYLRNTVLNPGLASKDCV